MITLTRVCRSWREIFISCPSLWTSLDCAFINKTRLYLERSKTSPLRIHLQEWFFNNAFLLAVPHLDRLGSLFLSGPSNHLRRFIQHFDYPSPLLKTLSLIVSSDEDVVLQDSIFGGDLSSLRKLHLDGVIPNLAWKNMPNLRTFNLCNLPADKISVTQLLDFFECAPLLCEILLDEAFPEFSDAPPGRIVPLPNLERLTITAQPLHTILMNHLLIPTGASIHQTFRFSDVTFPIHSHLPKDFGNLEHLSNITSINLSFNSGVHLRLDGPNGNHDILGDCADWRRPPASTCRRVLRSLDVFPVSTVEKLTIAHWQFTASSSVPVEKSSAYHTLNLMNNLRTLTLIACVNLRFISALNPKDNRSGTIVCPKLEKLIVYVGRKDRFFLKGLLVMAKERSLRGAKLQSVIIIRGDSFVPVPEVLELRTCVSHVEYRLDSNMHAWDFIPKDFFRLTDYDSD